jgi:PAS domain S-box-containing protein
LNSPKILIDDSALDRLDLPIFIKNTDGIYVYCNQAFIDFLGISKNKILGHTAYEIAPRRLADVYAKADKELFAQKGEQTYGANVQSSETEARVVFNKAILHTQDDRVAGFIGSINVVGPVHESRETDHLEKLTPRELDVLTLLAKGKSVKAIAVALMISPHTVTHYLKAIYVKLDVHSKNEALYKALALFTMKTP